MDKDHILRLLQEHKGKDRGISAASLAFEADMTAFATSQEAAMRKLRECIVALRKDGIGVCGCPESGYYLAMRPSEIDETRAFLLSRVRTTLEQEAALREKALPTLMGQEVMSL